MGIQCLEHHSGHGMVSKITILACLILRIKGNIYFVPLPTMLWSLLAAAEDVNAIDFCYTQGQTGHFWVRVQAILDRYSNLQMFKWVNHSKTGKTRPKLTL